MLFHEELGGARPDRLAGVRPQERVQRHTVELVVETFVFVPVLDAPEPPMVEQLVDVLALLEKQEREEEAAPRLHRRQGSGRNEGRIIFQGRGGGGASSGRRSCDPAARVPAQQCAGHSSCLDGYSRCKTVQKTGRLHRSRGAADVPVDMQRQVPAVRRFGCCSAEHCRVLSGAVLGKGDMRVVVQRQAPMGSNCPRRQLKFLKIRSSTVCGDLRLVKGF